MRKILCTLSILALAGALGAQPKPQPNQPNGPGNPGGPEVSTLKKELAELDKNRDGLLNPEEKEAAAKEIAIFIQTGRADGGLSKIRDQRDAKIKLLKLLDRPWPGEKPMELEALDPNHDGKIDEVETRQLLNTLSDLAPGQRFRKVINPFEKILDRNKDGNVDTNEIRQGSEILGRLISDVLAMEFNARQGGPGLAGGDKPVQNQMEALGDLNKDGKLSKDEQQALRAALGGPHEVKTDLDRLLDHNKNNRVEVFEIADGLKKRNIPYQTNVKQVQGPFKVLTDQDKVFDLNNDGQVSTEELTQAAGLVMNHQAKTPIPASLKLFDVNQDGKIQRDEVFRTMDQYFRPHPVRNVKDRSLDKNSDGFLSPEEIGVAAGYTTQGGTQLFDFYLDRARFGEDAPAPQNGNPNPDPGKTPDPGKNPDTGSKITQTTPSSGTTAAVEKKTAALAKYADKKFGVQVESTSTAVNKDTLKGLTTFVENAFVNTGKVKLVDRNNLDKILAEAEFQKSGLSEETQSVKAGKLSGAELMVTGTLTLFGKKYYLNLKITEVGNGEVVGSSVSEASAEEEFLEMVNTAVVSLF